VHNPRLDEEMRRETDSLTHGEPIEARVEEERLIEDGGDDDPSVEPFISHAAEEPTPGALTYDEVRSRSDLARHLRGSIFPADQAAIVQSAVEEHAPPAMLDALRTLPAGPYENVEAVWEALGGHREQRTRAPHDEEHEPAVRHFSFDFDLVHRIAGAPFRVSPATTSVVVDRSRGSLTARFGPWLVETTLDNVAGTEQTGPYSAVKTAGPARLSLADRGLTFATNDDAGLCIRFRSPVHGIDPLGVIRHPALTVTVDDIGGLRDALARAT
jgi:hypothetical protein